MKINECIAQHIIDVYEGNNWTDVNIFDTLTDVEYTEATIITAASVNTIASLINHLTFTNDVVMQRLSGINPVIPGCNGFDVAAIKNEDDWTELKNRYIQSAKELAATVRVFPENKLFELTVTGHSTYYKTLQGIVEHAHYHLGQIVLIKKLVKNRNHQPA